MNFKIASRQSQQRHLVGIDGINRQTTQTTRTTRPPCQKARHIVVVQASRRMFIMDDRTVGDASRRTGESTLTRSP